MSYTDVTAIYSKLLVALSRTTGHTFVTSLGLCPARDYLEPATLPRSQATLPRSPPGLSPARDYLEPVTLPRSQTTLSRSPRGPCPARDYPEPGGNTGRPLLYCLSRIQREGTRWRCPQCLGPPAFLHPLSGNPTSAESCLGALYG